MENYKEGIKYPKSELENIGKWWEKHREYDINQYGEYVEIALRPNWEKEQAQRLRDERARLCFPIINRGQLWYDKLTAEQKAELKAWYKAWLDITETRVKPTAPAWLK